MKKLFILLLLSGVISMAGFAQVTKTDFETTKTKMGVTKFNSVYVNNNKTFYTDGTYNYIYSKYTGDQTTVEFTATSVNLVYYTDNTKATISGITVVPYSSITTFVMSADLSITLKD